MMASGPGGGIPMILLTLTIWIPSTVLAVWWTKKALMGWKDPAEFARRYRSEFSRRGRDRFRAAGKALASSCLPFWGALFVVWFFLVDRIAQGWVDLRIGPPVSQTAMIGAQISLVFAIVGGLLSAVTYWWARPRFLIPPHLRYDPSYVKVLRARDHNEDVEAMYAASDERWRDRLHS